MDQSLIACDTIVPRERLHGDAGYAMDLRQRVSCSLPFARRSRVLTPDLAVSSSARIERRRLLPSVSITCVVRRAASLSSIRQFVRKGVFYLVVGGVLIGMFLLVTEIIIKRQKERLEKENELSRTALIRWKKSARVRGIERETAHRS